MTSPLQQKMKVHGPVVVTANRLADGAVIYRTADGWSTQLAAASVVTTSEAATALLAGARAEARIVDSYVAPVELGAGGPRPGNLRERIRAAGPTIRLPVETQARAVHVRA